MKIKIISSSVRDDRKSHHVALFLQNFFKEQEDTDVDIIDLKERDYPLFSERLRLMKEVHPGAQQFADEITEADAVIVLVPEYNGGYPASLKNVVDVLYDEWQQKPIALAPVSSGDMAGAQALQQMEFIFYKIGANVIKARFHVAKVQENFDAEGKAQNEAFYQKNAKNIFEGFKAALK